MRALAEIAQRIADTLAQQGGRAVALIDSPRWPRDLDLSAAPELRFRNPIPNARHIDRVLRPLLRRIAGEKPLNGAERLSMFPTPPSGYFLRCIEHPRCPPHLRAIGLEMFGAGRANSSIDPQSVSGGAIFTRFMIAGFAAYRAIERLPIEAYESYPDLLFRLAETDTALAPKSRRRAALANRNGIVARMAARSGITAAPPATLDQADAAILALSAAASMSDGAIVTIGNRAEGRFLLPLDSALASRFARLEPSASGLSG